MSRLRASSLAVLCRPVPADHGVYGGHGTRDTANHMPAANVRRCWLYVSAPKATFKTDFDYSAFLDVAFHGERTLALSAGVR
jgi:hypothetical protein